MEKGFATKTQSTNKTKKIITSKEPKGRLIPWSPWPPANFQTRYPAFPLVLTLLIIKKNNQLLLIVFNDTKYANKKDNNCNTIKYERNNRIFI